jgi:hypothetical protein
MSEIIDIADLDCVYLTYNEPQKEEFWIKIQNMVPWAVRVDGVKGSDAAHKAAAEAVDTDRFVLIDGDNMPDAEFFEQQLILDSNNQDCVFRWKAYNHINGLMYGNGGMSCWTKDFVYNMQTHEASDGSDETAVEFCYDPKYIAMHDCFSTTYPNATPEQAFRAGFREGVKMCLNRGTRPSLEEFEKNVVKRNYDHLCIWMSIGADVENGNWARAGAMLGTYLTMIGDNDDTFGLNILTGVVFKTSTLSRYFGILWKRHPKRRMVFLFDWEWYLKNGLIFLLVILTLIPVVFLSAICIAHNINLKALWWQKSM